jgi:chromosome segregation ATPase
MAEVTPEQLSRGVFTVAEDLLKLKGGIEREQSKLEAIQAEYDLVHAAVQELSAREAALTIHIAELERRHEELASGIAPEERALQEKLLAQHAEIEANTRQLDSQTQRLFVLNREVRDAEELLRNYKAQYLSIGGGKVAIPPATSGGVHVQTERDYLDKMVVF